MHRSYVFSERTPARGEKGREHAQNVRRARTVALARLRHPSAQMSADLAFKGFSPLPRPSNGRSKENIEDRGIATDRDRASFVGSPLAPG